MPMVPWMLVTSTVQVLTGEVAVEFEWLPTYKRHQMGKMPGEKMSARHTVGRYHITRQNEMLPLSLEHSQSTECLQKVLLRFI